MEWRILPTLPDFAVSSAGFIKRFRNKRNSRPDGIIKGHIINSGYLVVRLNFQGRVYSRLIHRLIAEAFWGPCPKGQEVNHRNHNKMDNSAMNLEYITRSANLIHSEAYRGERNGQAKLTTAQVFEIRRLHAEGLGYKRLAKRLGLSWSLVRNAASGRTWKYL